VANTTLVPVVGAAVLAGIAGAFYPSSATLYCAEFEALAEHPLSSGYPHCPPVSTQAVAFGSISASSQPFNSQTRLLRLHSTASCVVNVGNTNPIAAAGLGGSGWRLAAGVTEWLSVSPGDALSVIATT
jgi:hypothetical protein